jgi:hypothetical protein
MSHITSLSDVGRERGSSKIEIAVLSAKLFVRLCKNGVGGGKEYRST